MERIAGFGGLATFHSENNDLLVSQRQTSRTDNPAFARWRDETAKRESINRILIYATNTGAHVNVVHVSSPRDVALIAQASAKGVDATAGTRQHYLYFANQDIFERETRVTGSPQARGPGTCEEMRARVSGYVVLTAGSDPGPVNSAPKQRGPCNVLDRQLGFPGNETMVPPICERLPQW